MTQSNFNTLFTFNSSTSLKRAFVSFGVPFAKGTCEGCETLEIIDRDGHALENAIVEANTFWHDGSVKWANIMTYVEHGAHYYIATKQQNKHAEQIETPVNNYLSVQPDGTLYSQPHQISFAPLLTLTDGKVCQLKLTNHQSQVNQCQETLTASYQVAEQPKTTIHIEITFAPLTQQLSLFIRVENTHPASHPSGQWDLGDPNSTKIQNLSLQTFAKHKINKPRVYISDATQLGSAVNYELQSFHLVQSSSGGLTNNSLVHMDADQKTPERKHGFHLSNGKDKISSGDRAQPSLRFTSNTMDFWFIPNNFWQNFPCALDVSLDGITWQLFQENTELQPGESKEWQLQITPNELLFPEHVPEFETLGIALNTQDLNATNAFNWVHFGPDNLFKSLIETGVSGENSFFHKREKIDEYGWRHFGELYADHEALTQPKDQLFISHYNNQYDTLLGTTIQLLSSPSSRWSDVALPLACHIKDIDIYNTTDDKPEYNGGLFWHTDHYLPAATCTHRTYSKVHTAVYDGHQGGGGPGGQHCYTTGLTMHALLFNDQRAEQKVIQLTEWVRHFYNGNNSILGRLHRFVSIDLKPDQLTNIGFVKRGFRYPLDRGTGNYIVALLDSYELTSKSELITEAGFVIRNTIGCNEDLEERDLKNTENSWFYTVFLQALIRYLLVKESASENDDDYSYAIRVFNNLATWMAENEEPYLDNPEKLEFPNDTWAAQDLRKAVIFAYAGYFNAHEAQKYQALCNTYVHYVQNKLSNSAEASTTRILAILMQNYGVIEKARILGHSPLKPVPMHDQNYQGEPAIKRLSTDLLKIIGRFSLKSEWQWLRSRLPKKLKRSGDD